MDHSLPAILIGGPPHSGKSILLDRLDIALKGRQVDHYAFRASPDGEGDWLYHLRGDEGRALREPLKSAWTDSFSASIVRDVAQRVVPLLVDVGGKIAENTRQIAAHCTGAILLARSRSAIAPWVAMAREEQLPIHAILLSDLHSTQTVTMEDGILHGIISGLALDLSSEGPCFDALLDRVDRVLTIDQEELYRIHIASAKNSPVVMLDKYYLANFGTHSWETDTLPAVLASLDLAAPLALYGAAPMWGYASVGAGMEATPLVFNARWGWVTPPAIALGTAQTDELMRWEVEDKGDAVKIEGRKQPTYLDLATDYAITAPAVPLTQGVILSGQLPAWLFIALARAYRDHPWVAVHAARLSGAVVVVSRSTNMPVGMVIPVTR